MRLEARHGFTGTLDFAGLEPRRRYTCSVAFGQSTTDDEFDRVEYGHCSGRLRTFPDQNTNATMKFMLGSCNLHSLGFIQSPDPAYKRLARIASEENADFMIHCGDQIYYDIPNYL